MTEREKALEAAKKGLEWAQIHLRDRADTRSMAVDDALITVNAALAAPAAAQSGTLCDRVWFDGSGEWFTAEEVERHGTDGLREFVAVDSLPATARGVDVASWEAGREDWAEVHEAWALIDPNWGEPVPVLETIRDTEAEAIKAAITTSARGVSLYSGAALHCVPQVKGSIEALNKQGYRVGKVTITLPPAPEARDED
jgi:hypothetical protein